MPLRKRMDGAFTVPIPGRNYQLDYEHFLDGTSKTLLVGETNFGLSDWNWKADECSSCAGQTKWGDQTWAIGYWVYSWGNIDWLSYEQLGVSSYNTRLALNGFATYRVFRSDHPGGAQFVFVDGSVHFVPQDN